MDEIRDATAADVDEMIAVKHAATVDWDIPQPDDDPGRMARERELYGHLLRTGAGAVAVRDGGLIGFANAIVREDVWFLSQLFVRPDVQSAGTGGRLLDALLAQPAAREARVRSVLSSEDARALSVYMSRGMLPAGWSLMHLTRRVPPRVRPTPAEVSPLEPADQEAVDALDRAARGFARTVDHELFRAIGAGYAVRRGRDVAAYFYVQPGGRVAPLVARAGSALVGAVDAADALAGPDAAWDAPTAARALLARLLDLGYRPGWQATFCADGPTGSFELTSLAGGAFM